MWAVLHLVLKLSVKCIGPICCYRTCKQGHSEELTSLLLACPAPWLSSSNTTPCAQPQHVYAYPQSPPLPTAAHTHTHRIPRLTLAAAITHAATMVALCLLLGSNSPMQACPPLPPLPPFTRCAAWWQWQLKASLGMGWMCVCGLSVGCVVSRGWRSKCKLGRVVGEAVQARNLELCRWGACWRGVCMHVHA